MTARPLEILETGGDNKLRIHFVRPNTAMHNIIESVDSISRDGPDTPIYVIRYKKRINSDLVAF